MVRDGKGRGMSFSRVCRSPVLPPGEPKRRDCQNWGCASPEKEAVPQALAEAGLRLSTPQKAPLLRT